MTTLALNRTRLEVGKNAPFGPGATRGMQVRVDKFLEADRLARVAAAAKATSKSRSSFKPVRPTAPPRPGRSHAGRMVDAIHWVATKDGQVALDLPVLNRMNPYWIIQEVGTGETAVMRAGGLADQTVIRTIRSQKGRPIPTSLVWSSSPSGGYTPGGAATGQQLHLRSKVKGAPVAQAGDKPMRIHREIRGQHFIKKGSETGFREYETSVLAAARNAFLKGAEL